MFALKKGGLFPRLINKISIQIFKKKPSQFINTYILYSEKKTISCRFNRLYGEQLNYISKKKKKSFVKMKYVSGRQ